MFVNSGHLPQRLLAEHYTSPETHQKEMESLFLPGWHCVATAAQMPKIGDYRTIEILGRPLIIWNTSTGFRTYLNVCAHRFSTLTDCKQGHVDGPLKCQYHGWEYDQSGNTCKIPDAQSFRPLEKGKLGLREYPTELVGQLIFVTLQEPIQSLNEFLGPEIVALCEEWFGSDSRMLQTVDLNLQCNWKIAIENVLESYHLESVHPKTFFSYPQPEYCRHAFYENYDHYIHDYTHEAKKSGTWVERMVARMAGTTAELKWHHLLRYPNVVFGKGAPVAYVQMLWPQTPQTCRSFSLFMDRPGRKGRMLTELTHSLIVLKGAPFVRRVQLEDARLYPLVQQGTASPDRPYGGGLISIREERLFAFQDRILKALGEFTSSSDFPPTVESRSECESKDGNQKTG